MTSGTINSTLADLDRLIDRISDFAAETGDQYDVEQEFLDIYLAEARTGLRLISPYLREGQRILEIGSGVGALGHFLSAAGYDICGLEPGASGFGHMAESSRLVADAMSEVSSFKAQEKGCEALSASEDGLFDLIFSVHVVEHLDDHNSGFAAMAGVLKPGGKMVHICPNYRIPYEPHFSLPVLFWSPRLTRAVFRKTTEASPGLWASLNFIGAGDIKRIARRTGLSVDFRGGVMREMIERLEDDPLFRQRHQGWLGRLAMWIAGSPFTPLTGMLPASWVTPMEFTMRKPG